ncbi:MAG: hypothetical protein IJ844_01410, partial [Prevotella sp.]|nr:hypothetical protein [Prevotella sp.]
MQENGLYAGFFGMVGKNGVVQNVVLFNSVLMDDPENEVYRRFVHHGGLDENNASVDVGTLVGRNAGRIENCAVAGYTLSD